MIVRIAFSWIGFDPTNPLYVAIHEITEPILAPLRQFIPRIGIFDLTPMVAMILLSIIAGAARGL